MSAKEMLHDDLPSSDSDDEDYNPLLDKVLLYRERS